jgi:hypothetical protein
MALFFYLLCLVLWLGGIVFFGSIIAPVLFTRLTVAQAGAVVTVVFPRYHVLAYVCGAFGLLLAIYLALARGPRGWWMAAAIVLAIALGITLYDGLFIEPRVHEIRTVAEEASPDQARKAEFDRLHHLSATLFTITGGLNLVALIATAAALSSRK